MAVRLIDLEQRDAWLQALDRVGAFDTYHLPQYYFEGVVRSGERPILLVAETRSSIAALPLLLRRIPGFDDLWDAASAYGYPGGVFRGDIEALNLQFRSAAASLLSDAGVISCFVRQNPLIPSEQLFAGYSHIRKVGPTVAIDLRTPEAEYMATQTRKKHRYSLRQSEASGLEFVVDDSWTALTDFMRLYADTMKRTQADPYYYFPDSYFFSLRDSLTDSARLLHAAKDGQIISSMIVFEARGIAQYHLGGTSELGREVGASRWLIDRARSYLGHRGLAWFHLGGGVGASQDSLYEFKSGFSKLRFDYWAVEWIVDRQAYGEVLATMGVVEATAQARYFPLYRAPRVTTES